MLYTSNPRGILPSEMLLGREISSSLKAFSHIVERMLGRARSMMQAPFLAINAIAMP